MFNLATVDFTPNSVREFQAIKYDMNIYRYPENLGSAEVGHYVMFHINVQDKTNYSANYEYSAELPTVIKNLQQKGSITQTSTSNFNTALEYFNISKLPEKQTLFRNIRRTNQTIALYMPNTLVFADSQTYDVVNLNKIGSIAALGNIGASILGKGPISKEDYRNLTPFAAAILGQYFLGNANLINAATTGVVSNPLLEMIYNGPSGMRNFQFDFSFYPRNENEADEVIQIINQFRFHQAPEIAVDGGGAFLRPPSEFDIEFHYNGTANPNIPKISTCVLTSLNVDYSPGGPFTAYEVPGDDTPRVGGTGTPTAIRLTLSFTETEMMTKENYKSEIRDISFPTGSSGLTPTGKVEDPTWT